MTQKGLYYDAENPSAVNDNSQDYPMAEAVPIMDSPVEAYSDEESGRPPSVNPNYHALDNGDQNEDQNVPTISATPANSTPTTTTTTAVNSTQNTVTTVHQPQPLFLGRHPTTVVCPHCHTEMRTRTFQHANIFTWVAALLLSLVCCLLCLVPFCCRSCKETEHYCTNCHRLVSKVGPFTFSSK